MTTKEMIAVMQAYVDGKKIQIASKRCDNWEDYGSGEPLWNWQDLDYRQKR